MTPTCTRTGCGRPCPDMAYLCGNCSTQVRDALAQIVGLADELAITVTRQHRLGPAGKGSGEAPLPFAPHAADLERRLWHALYGRVKSVAQVRGVDRPAADPGMHGPAHPPGKCQHGSCATAWQTGVGENARRAAWLLSQLGWVRHQPGAGQLHDELTGLAVELSRAVDLPQPQRWFGRCAGCGAQLYGRATARRVRCGECDTEHDADAALGLLLDTARDQLWYAERIGRVLPGLGLDCTPAQVRGWARYGRLKRRGRDHAGRWLYRVGDAIEIARQGRRTPKADAA